MNLLSKWILSVMLTLVPPQKVESSRNESVADATSRYGAMARDIAEVVENNEPLFSGPDAEVKTAALITSVAYFEGNFMRSVDEGKLLGDHGNSWCHMQLHIGRGHVMIGDKEMKTWSGPDLIKDRKKCFKAGLEVLRYSIETCSKQKGAEILSAFTTGKCLPGQREAKNRLKMVKDIMEKHPFITSNSEINAVIPTIRN